MKKMLMLGIGMMIGMMLGECQCCQNIKKPIKKAMKKINIE